MTSKTNDHINATITVWTKKLTFKYMTSNDGEPYYWLLTESGKHIASIFVPSEWDDNSKRIPITTPCTIEIETASELIPSREDL